MRLIDAEAVSARLKLFQVKSRCLTRDYKRGLSDGVITAAEWIEEAPTIDTVAVVHAEWVEFSGPDANRNMYSRCSACGAVEQHATFVCVPYCWKCGAKMDKED